MSSEPADDIPFATVMREGTRRTLASVDAEAERLKLYPGQTLAYARALVPDLFIAEADDIADREGLVQIGLDFLKFYSPIVAFSALDTLLLDTTGCAHLFGSEENLLNDLLERLKAQQIRAKASIADTVGCAWAFTRCSQKTSVIVPSNRQKNALAPLPIAALRLPSSIVYGLAQLGFTRVEQLYATPRAPLVRRFGAPLMLRLDQALGTVAEPLDPLSPLEVPQEKSRFTEPVSNPDYLAQAVEQLAERLCKKLEAKGLGVRRLDLLFHRLDNALQAIRIGTVSASRDPKHYMRLFKENFDKVDCGFGIESLTLRAPFAEPLHPKQCLNVLGGAEQPDLCSLIDILHTRLGAKHVYRTTSVESDVPERSVKRTALSRTVGEGGAPRRGKGTGIVPLFPRPARLLRRPEKVDAMALLPDHAPVQFVWRRKHYCIKRADGPERIFGEWWKGSAEAMAVRDYFQVEDEKGERFWLFRRGDGSDPRTGTQQWFLHGFFG